MLRHSLLALGIFAGVASGAPVAEVMHRLNAQYEGQTGFGGARAQNDYLVVTARGYEAWLRYTREFLLGFESVPVMVEFVAVDAPPPAPCPPTIVGPDGQALGFGVVLQAPSDDYLRRHYLPDGSRRPPFGVEKPDHYLRVELARKGAAFFPASVVRVVLEAEEKEPLLVEQWRVTAGIEIVRVESRPTLVPDAPKWDGKLKSLPKLGPRPPSKRRLWDLDLRFRDLDTMLKALDEKEVLLAVPGTP